METVTSLLRPVKYRLQDSNIKLPELPKIKVNLLSSKDSNNRSDRSSVSYSYSSDYTANSSLPRRARASVNANDLSHRRRNLSRRRSRSFQRTRPSTRARHNTTAGTSKGAADTIPRIYGARRRSPSIVVVEEDSVSGTNRTDEESRSHRTRRGRGGLLFWMGRALKNWFGVRRTRIYDDDDDLEIESYSYKDLLSLSPRLHMILCLIPVVLLCLSIVGCVSGAGAIPNLHVLELSYTQQALPANSTGSSVLLTQFLSQQQGNSSLALAKLAVRVSYFGLCYDTNKALGKPWICTTSWSSNAVVIDESLDPLGLIGQGFEIRKHAIFPYITIIVLVPILSAAITLLMASSYGAFDRELEDQTESKASSASASSVAYYLRPHRRFVSRAVILLTCAFVLQLVSQLWQLAGAMTVKTSLQAVFAGYVRVQVGAVAQVLGWLGLLFIGLIVLGLMYGAMRNSSLIVDD